MNENRQPLSDHVDPFIGTEEIDLPEPAGIAATWYYLKAQIANTHPGATRPFSLVSAVPYSGAYPTGYGVYDVNTNARPGRLHQRKLAYGVAHVQVSGAGFLGAFYNLVLVSPAAHDGDTGERGFSLEDEVASPGSYRCRFAEADVEVELTTTGNAAVHRYRFPPGATPLLRADLSNCGLRASRGACRPSSLAAQVDDDGVVVGRVTVQGVDWYVALAAPGAATPPRLWDATADRAPSSLDYQKAPVPRCGAFFAGEAGGTGGGEMELVVALSVGSKDHARAALAEALGSDTAAGGCFGPVARKAHGAWDSHLGRIQVDGAGEPAVRQFATALYHASLKPVAVGSPNPLWNGGPDLYADFATIWDMYKTQLPLLFALDPERGSRVVQSMLATMERFGFFPCSVLLWDNYLAHEKQAKALSHPILLDAYDRGLPGVDWENALALMARVIRTQGEAFGREGLVYPLSHTLDWAYACHCTGRLARALGEAVLADEMHDLSGNWVNAFDRATGYMRADSDYYEGGHVHYSFRLLHDMAARMALFPGDAPPRDRLAAALDRFFGYGAAPVEQQTDTADGAHRKAGMALGRFDGTNNEVMMETPYAYAYAGRHDRLCEVVRGILRYHYADCPGGVPGNDDSGGLGSWYVWNALGLFPVPGQGIYLIGSPTFPRATIPVQENAVTIESSPAEDGAIYVAAARWNGAPLDRAYLTYSEVASGGVLSVDLSATPSTWAAASPPPSVSDRRD
jgi:predicted alpha-1,2-mannosidase